MKRIILALYGIVAVAAALYPALSEALVMFNHNETLVRDGQ
jgi:hypothetical protein